MKKIFFSTLLLISLAAIGTAQPAWLTDELKLKTQEFDFWIGEWDVYKFGTDTIVGSSKIESIVDGFGMLENYRSTTGAFYGTSLNKYNFGSRQWEQFWVDNSGVSLHITGGIVDDKMVLENQAPSKNGTTHNKISWTPLSDGTVRQSWDVSQDEGKTWQRVFDGLYKKRKK